MASATRGLATMAATSDSTSASSASAGDAVDQALGRAPRRREMKSPVTSISKAALRDRLRDSATLGVEQNRPRLTPRHGEARIAAGHRQVAHRHQLAARRGGDAVHTRDHRHRQRWTVSITCALREQALVVVERGLGAHLLQVVAGAEGLAGCAEHDDARRFVTGDRLELRLQRREHAFGQRVEGTRAIQRQA
jgi:hypothetical protein